jgi:hypothetical protein
LAKSIDTLVQDIYDLLVKGGEDIPDEKYEALGRQLGESVKGSLRRQRGGTLRMSSIGQPCNRKLWYSVNRPEEAEGLTGSTYMKFLTGHILEDLLLFLAEESGHEVTGRQDTLEVSGIVGHRDAVIDGTLVDAKSASTYSFKKFEEHQLSKDDPFGYIDQLEGYRKAGEDDPLVTDKDRAAFLVVDKTLGNICLDIHEKSSFPIEKVFEYKKEVVKKDEPPARGFDPVPEGKSGNLKLGTNCSYCDFKHVCHPDLRTFLYSGRPVFLTKVVREPNVPESRTEG